MRLSKLEVDIIKESVHRLDPKARIFLYGSRAVDTQKGGDIDLLVLSPRLSASDKIKIKAQLFKKLEEQKIDLTIAADTQRPFVRLALRNGVRL